MTQLDSSKTRWRRIGRLRFRFEFKPADCWIGLYTAIQPWRYSETREVWVCVLPMLPLHLRWRVREWTHMDLEQTAQLDTELFV
jgi:hypothetical protein